MASSATDCERFLIEKLISILSKTLDCGGKVGSESEGTPAISESETSIVQKLLRILISQTDEGGFGRNGSFLGSSDGTILPEMNSSNLTFLSGDDSDPSSSSIIITGGGGGGGDFSSSPNFNPLSPSYTNTDGGAGDSSSIMTNKLHKLELIKVFVLIFVISIILLTTCRMVFQLFIRFRPEKPPLG